MLKKYFDGELVIYENELEDNLDKLFHVVEILRMYGWDRALRSKDTKKEVKFFNELKEEFKEILNRKDRC